MRKPVFAVGILVLSLGAATAAVAALVVGGSRGAHAAHAAVGLNGLIAAEPAFPASCARRSPLQVRTESWSLARRELAPVGASAIRLCRYSGGNDHPPRALVHSVLLSASNLVRDLVREFDELPSQGPGGIACPSDDGSQIVALLAYPGGQLDRIAVHLAGCQEATNGSVFRLALGVGSPPAFGPQLVAQLERLTASEPPVYQTVRPPTPQVSTLGVTGSATLVSYLLRNNSAVKPGNETAAPVIRRGRS